MIVYLFIYLLVYRFVDPLFSFNAGYKATIGSDLKSKEIMVDDKPIVLQIWDTGIFAHVCMRSCIVN
jgi:GTPase SAR1 family protein